ncbi:MAG: rhodanese-like domain-containing protein [Gammaproteobacteria bacterium]|nr:rhodanese-like domain-containing protein [Gammaproteobacteria bacterium]
MEQLIEFAGNHLALVAALAVILFLFAQNIMADMGGKAAVTPQQATELINRKDAIVVDVRPIADFSKAHIINAINIPMSSFKNQLTQLEKHKGVPVIVSCRSGAQSSGARKILSDGGFDETYNLKGGIMAWESASLPVSRK